MDFSTTVFNKAKLRLERYENSSGYQGKLNLELIF